MSNWLVDGVDLSAEFGLVRGTTWRPPVSARNAVVEVPGRHGSVVSGRTSLEAPTVTLQLLTKAVGEDALGVLSGKLQSLLGRPAGVTLTRVQGTVSASAHARLVSLSPVDVSWQSGVATWTAVLTVPGVTFRGTVVNSASLAASSNTTLALPTLAGSSAPIRDAILRLSGPATSFSWTCPTSGTGISWAGSLLAGYYLYVDVATLTAWRTTSASAWAGAGAEWQAETARLDYPSAGPLQLWPRVSGASTVVEVAIAGGGRTTATDLVVRAAPTYL